MAIAASRLPLVPSLSVGDAVGLSVFVALSVVTLWLLHAGGRLRLGQIAAMGAIGAFALGFLIGLASVQP